MGEPPWLTAAVDQRLALLADAIRASDIGLVMTSLTEPPETATPEERASWDRRCDRCGKDCTHTSFFTGHVQRELDGVQVIFVFGVCAQHSEED